MEYLEQARPYRQDRTRLASFSAGCGALLCGLLFLAAFLLPGNELSQHFILSIAPLALLPTILFLHRLFRWDAPALSRLALLFGLLGAAPALIQLVAGGFLRIFGGGDRTIGQLDYLQPSLAFMGVLLGLWLAAIAFLGWSTSRMPLYIAVAGWVAGLSRMGISGSMAFSSFSTLPFFTHTSLWNLGLLVWIASTLIFLTWLGLRLISGKTSPG